MSYSIIFKPICYFSNLLRNVVDFCKLQSQKNTSSGENFELFINNLKISGIRKVDISPFAGICLAQFFFWHLPNTCGIPTMPFWSMPSRAKKSSESKWLGFRKKMCKLKDIFSNISWTTYHSSKISFLISGPGYALIIDDNCFITLIHFMG